MHGSQCVKLLLFKWVSNVLMTLLTHHIYKYLFPLLLHFPPVPPPSLPMVYQVSSCPHLNIWYQGMILQVLLLSLISQFDVLYLNVLISALGIKG